MFAVIALGLLLKLIPPGHSERLAQQHADTAHVQMPRSLAAGSRASEAEAPRFATRTSVSPAPARLGQQLTFRTSIVVPVGANVRFDRPEPGGNFTWGVPSASHRSLGEGQHGALGYGRVDSFTVVIPVQAFATGKVTLPGLGVQVDMTRQGGRSVRVRTPGVTLLVIPTVTAADSAQGLRPVRGPLGAPWWERVAWRIVLAALAALAALAGAWWWWARLRRRAHPVAAPAPMVRPARDPALEALAELARLRALGLPRQGRFADHAFELTRILRRYLEAVLGTPRPGDTSSELLARLAGGAMDASDMARLELLLSLWDRVKFARAPLDVTEAERCEQAVEVLVRRRLGPKEAA